jgi:hypothetical protein
MVDESAYTNAVGDLRTALVEYKPGQREYDNTVACREEAFARYRPIFSTAHIPDLSKEEFTSFLYIENNRHWDHLYRKGLGAAADMNRLREALGLLLDEAQPIDKRFSEALGKVAGLGKAIASAILTVAYPEKYGVWNNASEGALQKLGVWPQFERGEGIGARYAGVNSLLARLRSDLGTDFWTLDLLWFSLPERDEVAPPPGATPGEAAESGGAFSLEKQLEDFLLDNWEHTVLGRDWDVGDGEGNDGDQYPTEVGPIDILAKHKTKPAFLVVELKRGQSSDQTVGQVLRYIGFVKKHLAKDGQAVEGLIIAHKVDKATAYAVSTLQNVKMMTYGIEFHLKDFVGLP